MGDSVYAYMYINYVELEYIFLFTLLRPTSDCSSEYMKPQYPEKKTASPARTSKNHKYLKKMIS